MDVISDVLRSAQLTTLFYGRWELGAPWAIHVRRKPTSSFYVLARGRARLTLGDRALGERALGDRALGDRALGDRATGERTKGNRATGEQTPGSLSLSAGDVVLVPRGSAHVLDDGSRSKPPTRRHRAAIDSEVLGQSTRLGGDGPQSSLVAGCFRFASGEHPLLRALPPTIHLRSDDARGDRRLATAVELMVTESAARGPGSELILGRLADVLLAQALRVLSTATEGPGWRALADPQIGRALQLLHARFGEPWTVAGLGTAVGMSRSGLAARFRDLVGETPSSYLARVRMAKAAGWLRETNESVEQIATRVGYESTPAFRKAFKRHHGEGPGEYRRFA
ncbi:MAG: AraC family transcriptional regulator [Myxococcota bacterium]